MLEQALDSGPPAAKGIVYLIGAGPASPESLTMRALRVLQMADVVLYDNRAAPAVLELARREAEKIDIAYDAALELALREAGAGKRVVWLREGDPLQALAMRGAALEVVPGVTRDTRVGT
jgi:uroporphyrin-III C-methyltransferase/precorrin-2 dehydrogenase/sirohydrochlorin ferrochelatase